MGGRKRRTPGEKNSKPGPTGKHTIVFGMVEREGNVRAGPIPDVKQTTVEPIILTNVQRGSIISTDELKSYADLRRAPYRHGTVRHIDEEWVRGEHHTNTIEGFWSQLKRSIRGTHVHVSAKHLWKYVAEFSYRRNTRISHEAMFRRLVISFSLPRVAET
jgi:transposase